MESKKNDNYNTDEDVEKCRRCIGRRQWRRTQQDCVVSDRLLDLESKLMVISDTKIFNELFLDMDVELKRLHQEKSNKKRKIVRMQRTEFMKQRDNLRQSLRRCELKKREAESGKYTLKLKRLSREYEDVCRSIIVETASDTVRTNARSNNTAIVAAVVTVATAAATAAVTAPMPATRTTHSTNTYTTNAPGANASRTTELKPAQLRRRSTTATELVSDTTATATVPASTESVVCNAPTPPPTEEQNDTDDEIDDSISLGNTTSTGRKSTPAHSPTPITTTAASASTFASASSAHGTEPKLPVEASGTAASAAVCLPGNNDNEETNKARHKLQMAAALAYALSNKKVNRNEARKKQREDSRQTRIKAQSKLFEPLTLDEVAKLSDATKDAARDWFTADEAERKSQYANEYRENQTEEEKRVRLMKTKLSMRALRKRKRSKNQIQDSTTVTALLGVPGTASKIEDAPSLRTSISNSITGRRRYQPIHLSLSTVAAVDLAKPNLLPDDATLLTKGIQKETIEVIDDENDDKDEVNNEIIETEESNNENIIELLDDCDDKSNDVGNKDNEDRTIEIETFNENIIDLIDDDDDDDSGGDVVEKAPAEGKYDDDNGGIEFVGSKGINPLSDFPHSREDCVKNLFRIDPAKFCHQCYCYVCDINAKDCPKWEDNHCFAQSTDRIWKQRRSAARSKRKSSKEKILHRALHNIDTSIYMVVSSTTDLPSKRRRINVNYRS